MSRTGTAVICGGGVIGLSCAEALARDGWRVVLVERNAEGADSCAHGSAGYLSPSHVVPLSAPGMVWKGLKWMLSSRSPFYIKPRFDLDLFRWGWIFASHCTEQHTRRAAPILRDLCTEGRRGYVALSEQTGNSFELRTEGLLNLCKTQETLDHESHGLGALARELGVEVRTLDAKQTAEAEPGIRMDVVGSVYFPFDAHLSPRLLMPVLTARVKELGVDVRWGTEIRGWRAESGRLRAVATSAGEIEGDEFVLAGGSWSPSMVAGLGIRLPMQPGKGYSLTIEKPRFRLTKSVILTERRCAVTPMGPRLRFGGTMELSGHSDDVRPERIDQIKQSARLYFPEMAEADFDGVPAWFGYRPVSPDGLPYIGRFRAHPNLSAACGHAMLGLSMAPSTAALVAEILGGRKPSIDLALLDPDRFA
jgi:D-amino-acid dehydrogenase